MVKTSATSKIGLASIARSSNSRPPTPLSGQVSSIQPPSAATDDKLRAQFTSAAIGMSWQLLLIVLIPIIGGYKLDARLASTPMWTLIGLVLALIGSIVIIKRAVGVFGGVSLATGSTADTTASTDNKTADKTDRDRS